MYSLAVHAYSRRNCLEGKKQLTISTSKSDGYIKKALYLSVNVFSTKVLIGDTIFDGTAILRDHPSHEKVQPLLQCKRSTFISQLF